MLSTPIKHFSTVEFIKNLKIANFTEPQIEILAKRDEEQSQQLEQVLEIAKQTELAINSKESATKGDVRESELLLKKEIKEVELTLQKKIKEVELTLQKEIKEVELTLKKEIALIESRLTKWVIGVGISSVIILCGAMFSMFKLMVH